MVNGLPGRSLAPVCQILHNSTRNGSETRQIETGMAQVDRLAAGADPGASGGRLAAGATPGPQGGRPGRRRGLRADGWRPGPIRGLRRTAGGRVDPRGLRRTAGGRVRPRAGKLAEAFAYLFLCLLAKKEDHLLKTNGAVQLRGKRCRETSSFVKHIPRLATLYPIPNSILHSV